jgi:N,N'-diacetyllegionaminate synthase
VYARCVSVSIEIGRHRIGDGHPCFIIAEVGVNHNGDLRLAHELIDVAAAAGADAVKFQSFTPTLLAAEGAPLAAYQESGDIATSQLDMLADLALGESAHFELKAHADAAGITFLSSAFDEASVALLERLGVAAFKIPSGEVTNNGLLRRVADTGKPILMSTGMCTFEDVDSAVADLGPAIDRLALLHCVSSYPADPRDCNLLVMDVMKSRYQRPVGWSDHTEGTAVAIAAAALGAAVIEKHITLSRSLPGPDQAASIEPPELRAMTIAIRSVEAALGMAEKRPSDAELATAAVARKSLHWRRPLAPGDEVRPGDLIALRPGTGIAPGRLVELVGRRVRVRTIAGSLARPEDLAPGPLEVNS